MRAASSPPPRGSAKRIALAAAAAAACLDSPQARAQLIDQYLNTSVPGYNVQPGVTVASRLRPEYDYAGVRLGSFVFSPELAETTGYDSNVTGTRPAHGSAEIETNATLQARSDWSRNSLGGALTVDNHSYPSQSNQSYTNWTATGGGTYEIGRDVLYFGASHLNLNQTPRDLDVPQLDRTIAFRVEDVRLNYRANFARTSVTPGVDVAYYDFDNGSVAGVPYLQNYRNRVVITPSVEADYQLAPLRTAVVVVRDSNASYTNRLAGTPVRDFNDASVLAGLNYDVDGVIGFRLLAGYERRDFTSRALKPIQAPIVEFSSSWTPTGLTTVTGTVARYIEDSASEVTVGYTETAIKLNVDHEYLRNVLLNANAGVYLDDYSRNQGHQEYYAAGAGVTWLLNRHMRLAATYDFSSRQTNSVTSDLNAAVGLDQVFGGTYAEHRALLQLRIGL